ELDAHRRSAAIQVILLLGLLLSAIFIAPTAAQDSDSARLQAAQHALDAQRWQEAAKLAAGPPEQPAELDFIRGLALARLGRWDEARAALESGRRKASHDARFPAELAGVAYKQKNFAVAKRELHAALRLNPSDQYTRDFLGTIYFLEGNLEATLKYWNRIEKPRLNSVSIDPLPLLDDRILRH